MGRLDELRINAYLSEVARGYSNNAFIAGNLFPEITSDLEKVDIFEFNKEAFSVYNTERAIRANSNVVSPKGFTKKTATLTEHDLAYPIDYREEEESKKVKLQLHATNVVTEGLRLKHEKQCADLVQNVDNFPTGHKLTLSGDDKFSVETTSDPVGVIDDAKDAIAGKIAQDPNTMIIGHETWKVLKRHKQIQGLISDNQNKIITLNFLKEIFEIPNIFIGKSVFVDEAGSFTRVWGDNIVLAYVPQLSSRTEYDPAFAYTIKKKNSLNIDEYSKEGNKVKYIRATDIYTPFLVGAEAGYLIKDTN
ncbi:MAG TPA: hypothetical protein P5556_10895 [Candidatus Gastranaerophilales bacterium]|nr:hypothetical protein [Candidatus Gastranaerophilales bacterium]